jgi:hypothetical protein
VSRNGVLFERDGLPDPGFRPAEQTVLAGDTRVLAISHGGLDTAGAGALVVVLLAVMDVCQAKVGRAG